MNEISRYTAVVAQHLGIFLLGRPLYKLEITLLQIQCRRYIFLDEETHQSA